MRLIKGFFFFLLLYSCDKNPEPVNTNNEIKNGALVLCEGLFQHNNSQLSYIDFENQEVENGFFLNRVERQLGDTGNDIKRYGDKIYIVVNVSSTIEVIDAQSFESLKQISMTAGGTAKQPRNIDFYKNHAFVSCFDGFVDVIDTLSLELTQRIQVGTNPDQLLVIGHKLYVSNSGGLNYPQMDSTVSIIDLNSLNEIKKMNIGLNPGPICADDVGNAFIICRGNYGNIPSKLIKIDTDTDEISEEFNFSISGIAKFGNKFLINSNSGNNTIALFNPINGAIEDNSFISANQIETLYGIQYNEISDKLYLMDAMNYTNTGYVFEYDALGNFLNSYHVGLNPSKLLFFE